MLCCERYKYGPFILVSDKFYFSFNIFLSVNMISHVNINIILLNVCALNQFNYRILSIKWTTNIQNDYTNWIRTSTFRNSRVALASKSFYVRVVRFLILEQVYFINIYNLLLASCSWLTIKSHLLPFSYVNLWHLLVFIK